MVTTDILVDIFRKTELLLAYFYDFVHHGSSFMFFAAPSPLFHHFNILNEPLAFEDMKICGLGFKLDFK
jgi:hypothetical protein